MPLTKPNRPPVKPARILLAVVLLAVLALSRWPGLFPPNFSPVYALAFCAGVYLPGRLAWWVPLGVCLCTDVLLNVHYGVQIFGGWLVLNLLGYAALTALGRRFSSSSSWLHLLTGGLVGAVLFYFITNTIAWFNPLPGPFPQEPYPRTLMGWIQALTVGSSPWPPTWTFFRNTLWSGGLFTGLFVGAMKLGELASSRAPEQEDLKDEDGPETEPEPEAAS